MSHIYDLVVDRLEEDGEDEDLADWVSEGEGEEFDSLEPPIEIDESFPTSIMICGVPSVDGAKYDKLMGILNKVIDKYGENEKHMPVNEATGKTDGVVFVTFQTQQAVDNAKEQLNNFALDKKHTFKVVKMDEFDEIMSRRDEFEAQRTLTSFSRADQRLWLADPKCREQLLLRYQAETEIYWHDTMVGNPVLCYGGEREKAMGKVWCDWLVQWSPQGSYLATFHAQGIALWGGERFEKKVRLPHAKVKAVDFSPTEDYVLLWNGSTNREGDDNAVAIFHVLTGQCVKKCRTPPVTPPRPGRENDDFPHFLWSADGKYFAECNESRILVRDTESFELIKDESGKRSALKYDALHTFQWSPKDSVIAVWTLEKDNNPARLVLVEVPSRRELASRSRTQCEATMHWQSEGDYLCLLVTKLSKTKKKMGTNLEIFRIREKSIPVEIIPVGDVTVRGFFWETRGNRFAILTADEAGHKPKLQIYLLGPEKAQEICTFDLPSNSFNSLFWAPDGQYFVCAALQQGDLLFGGLTADNKLEILHKDEHFMLTNVEWDPSSRYVITAVTQPMQNDTGGYRYSMEAGFAIWTFQGRVLYRQQKEKLYQVAWRPHPPSLLPPNRQREIRKNIKQFSKKYDSIDDQAKESARAAFRRDRQEKTNAFKEVLERLAEYKEERAEENGWEEAMDAFQEGHGWIEDEQVIEEELEVTEELIPQG